MLMPRQTNEDGSIIYPDSDGQPMADNTRQFRWIYVLAGNLAILFYDRDDLLVGCNHFWYPVEGDPKIRAAPNVYVVFGRPKGERGSYKQWEEGGVPITVAFEVVFPGASGLDWLKRMALYEEYGVEEYYAYDPDTNCLYGFRRLNDALPRVRQMNGFEVDPFV